MILTIVVPVYNVDKYLGRCINSLTDQDLSIKDYEIIAVNDGSTDGSLETLIKLKKAIPNLKIITQNNQGQAVARNNGIDSARGKYLMFVDSDDYINRNVLKQLVETASKRELDILGFEYNYDYNGKITIRENSATKYNIITDSQDFISNGFSMLPCWFCLYTKELFIVNSIRFRPGIFHEDLELMPRLIFAGNRFMMTDLPVYNYVKRSNSNMSSRSPENIYKLCIDNITVAISLHQYFSKIELRENVRHYIYSVFIENAVLSSLGYILKGEVKISFNKIQKIYNLIIAEGLVPLTYRNKTLGEKILSYFLKHKFLFYLAHFTKVYYYAIKIKNRS